MAWLNGRFASRDGIPWNQQTRAGARLARQLGLTRSNAFMPAKTAAGTPSYGFYVKDRVLIQSKQVMEWTIS